MESSGVIDPDEFARMFEFNEPAPADLHAGTPRPTTALFSAHGHVMIAIARDPSARIPQIAERTDLSEHDVCHIVRELIARRMITEVPIGSQRTFRVAAGRSAKVVDRLYGVSPA